MFWDKRIISLFIGIICFNVNLYSQVYTYCEVIETKGQVNVVFSNNPIYISESYQQQMISDIETNKPIKFANGIDCITHLGMYGWEVVSSTQYDKTTRYLMRHIIENNYYIGGRLQRDIRIMEEYEKKYRK